MIPAARKLIFPLKKYKLCGLGFNAKLSNGRINGIHLGEDVHAAAGEEIGSIGNGEVVYAALHPGSPQKGNWGNIVIIEHHKPRSPKKFYSLYGHLDRPLIRVGDEVKRGQKIGVVAPSNTSQNGWWPAHLHFAIYIGPWQGVVLPGYYQEGSGRTLLEYWQNPSQFVKNYLKKV